MRERITICLALMMLFFNVQAGNYLYQPEQGMVCQWNKEDIVGIYTQSGDRLKFWISEIGQDAHETTITAPGWSLAANTQYYIYSPYTADFYLHGNPITALPVSYSGQMQKGNGSTSHLTQYDYMRGMTTTTATTADFALSHYGSVMHIAYKMPMAMAVSEVKIMSDDKVLPVSAVMNLPQQSLSVTEYAEELFLMMDNVQLAEGDTLDAFMMLPSVDLDDRSLSFCIINGQARDTLKIMTKGCNIVAGRLYEVPLSKMKMEEGDKMQTAETTLQSSLVYPCATVSDFALDKENRFRLDLLGDANGDEELTADDAYLIMRYFLGFPNVKINLRLADVNNDGVVTMADANEIMNILQIKK